MVRRRLLLALALFVFCRPPAVAENAGVPRPGGFLSLETAVRTGLETHPAIAESRHRSQISAALAKQARGDRYPWLEASVAESSGALRIVTTDGKAVHDRGGHGFDPGGALPHHNQNMVTGGVLLNQLITDFGYTAHRIVAREAEEAASEKAILTNKAYVILTVQKAYLSCLLQQHLVAIAAETVARRKVIREQIGSLYKNQLKSKVDLDLMQVEVSNAEMALIRAQNDLNQAFAELNNAMGLERSDRYRLEELPVLVVATPDIESLVSLGIDHRPELLSGRDRIVASEEFLRAAQALHFGSVTAVGSVGITKYGTVHDGGIPSDGLAPFWGLGATAKLPIFTGFRIQNQIKEAGAHKGESEAELQSIANEVVLQVVRAYLTKTTNAEQIALEQDRVMFAKEALTLAQERYRLGLSPIVEVVRATTGLFEAESRLKEAQYIYKTSEAALAYATGQDYKRF
jgi:outer membrane protein TolC